ncbi:fibronectin type III domain-containing protein [Flavobacterium caeni]|nr:gliding motility-associated C-terminal domain-containing protein [Flavobacterium caeni]
MKKIILLILVLLSSTFGFAQVEDFEALTEPDPVTGVWALTSGNWLVKDNRLNEVPNWQSNDGTPYPANTTNGGSRAAFVNRENTGADVLAEEWLITPQFNIAANRQLRFYARQTVNGDSGTLYRVMISSNADPLNFGAYTQLAQYTETQLSTITSNQLDYEEKIINFGAVTGNRYIAFVKVHTQVGDVTGGDRWLIDDVKIVQRCAEPTTLATSNVSSTGATLSWVATADNYSIEYGPSGFVPGTGTVIADIPDGGATDSYVVPVGTLTPDTCYQFYVTAYCGSGPTGSSSLQTGPFNFCTSPLGSTCAGPIVIPPTLPYFTTDDTLQFGNNISAAGPGTSCGATGNFLGGNDVVYTYTNPNATPLNINIQMNPGTATNTGMFVYSSCANVGVNCIAGVGNANATIREITTLNLAGNQTIFIVLSSTTATESYPYTLAIQVVNCPAPTGGQAIANTIGMTDAQLTWTNPTSTSWEVAVQTAGSGIPAGAGFPTTNNVNLSAAAAFGGPLTAATQYEFWVRADCGNGTFSLWAGPYRFDTRICEAVNQCNYTFIVQDSFGDSWNGATMQVRQNGIVVATLTGPTNAQGTNPVSVTVPMCHNIPFDLFWATGGTFPGEVRVRIQNSFGQELYAMTTASAGLAGTSLYAGTVDCLNPLCLRPTGVTVPSASITTNGAVINWTSSGVPTTGWELYVVPQGTPAPLPETAGNYTVPTPPATLTIASGLTADTCYNVYVRSVCSVNSPSPWTATAVTFCTLPTCPKPTNIQVPTATITEAEATVTWTAVAAATGYQVAIIPSPSTLPIDEAAWSPVQTATTYTTATGALQSGTLYDVYVRSICLDGGDIGQPSNPTTFSTVICAPSEQCLYTFTLTDSFGDGWNGARMEVRQNGIVVQTLGANFTGGAGPIVVNVPLCHGVPFELFWTLPGSFPGEVRIAVSNNYNQQLYAITTASAGLAGTSLYSQEEVDCLAPLCLPPTGVAVVPNIFEVTINWTPSTFNTAYDIYIVETGGAAPDENTTPTYAGVTGTSFTTTIDLLPSTGYTVYVRAICDANSPSAWTSGVGTETLPTCPQPINLVVLGADTDSAELQWTEVGPATQWEVFVVPADSPVPTPGSGTIVNSTTFDTTVLGPLPAGLYDYYVRAICTPEDPSDISGPTAFFIINVDPVCPEVEITVQTTSPGVIDLCPGENCIDLSATFVDFKDTTTYAVDAVPFAPPFPFIGGTELNIATDDIWGPPVTLPFDFCFFGVNSQSVQVGSNGVVTFTPQAFPGNCPWAFTQTIPNAGFPVRNAIYGVYQDINPAVNTAPAIHSINYQILGTAPCRAFVVNYYQVGQFSCGTSVGLQTSQIVLYETSNIIEVYVQDRTVCSTWNSGSGVIGLQNAAGTQAHFPPGRNTGPWEAHNEGWRFTPDGNSNVVFTWLQGTTPVGNNATDIQVCVSETTLMTARAVYTGCGGTQTTEEVSVLLRINEVDIEPIEDVTQCDCYVLPALTEPLQHYYTATGGPNGTGTEIPAGTQICDPNTTIYVWAGTTTEPICSDEEEFVVNITAVVAPDFPDVTECTAYTLPDLPDNFFYFDQPDGGGNNLPELSDVTTVGTTEIWILGVNGECIGQSSFNVTIGDIVAFEQDDITDCNGFLLPALPANQTYHDQPNGGGVEIPAGTNITTPGVTTIYIHAQLGNCEDDSEFTITIDDQIVPTFNPIANICVGGTAPALPTQSTNQPTPITGSWNPATIDTSVAGTFTFTFTPDGTVPCAVETTINVTIDPLVTPDFTPIPPVCLNAVVTLPTTSNNGIAGTWLPIVDTSVTGTTTYTFTPDAGQNCAISTTIDVTVVPQITPTFNPIANICQFATAPLLPTVSEGPEAVPGTWSPATIDTNTPGMTIYTFTPDAVLAPCAVVVTMDITIDPQVTPAFDPIADVCVGGTFVLPTTSLNGVIGTWGPAIDTSVAGSYIICFTPNAGQTCAIQTCVTVNVIAPVVPDFTSSITLCFGDAAPVLAGTSPNGVTGTWSPAIVDNTLSGVYTFTPNAGQCAVPQIINVNVNPTTTPTFTQLGPICSGDTSLTLPATSNNGVSGVWSPATVNNQATTTYTFTPAAGSCATSVTMTIVVNPTVAPGFAEIAAICAGDPAPSLDTTSPTGITGTWSPSTVSNTQSGTYTFTPTAGQCSSVQVLTVTVTNEPQVGLTEGCDGSNYVLTAVPLNGSFDPETVTYSWTANGVPVAGADGQSIVITETGDYVVTVTPAGGCPGNAAIDVDSTSCIIQKGISPGDGSDNDFFDLAGLNVRRLEIFNRYGTKVYSQANYSREWYGQTDKGDELPDGTYYYVIERDTETKTGWIYINRVK